MSIVELMVGVAIGLLIVAAATLMMSGQLSENRRLLVEAQLQQDLRAAADIMTREIRRTGAMIEPHSLQTVWFDGATLVQHNDIAASLAVGGAAAPPVDDADDDATQPDVLLLEDYAPAPYGAAAPQPFSVSVYDSRVFGIFTGFWRSRRAFTSLVTRLGALEAH
jgi:uncharacterized protein YneF (UPF0154 family)